MVTLEPALLGELLALLAHDLRNPLSALRTNLGFLASLGTSEDLRETVADGLASCDGLSYIIDNVDRVGRALRESDGAALSPVRLAGLLSTTVGRVKLASRSHEVRVDLSEAARRATATVRTHQELFVAALECLVRNAIQLSPPGSAVSIDLRAEARRATVLIEDAGPRLDPALRQVAFTPAGQVTLKGQSAGRYSRGLGLWCAELAASNCGAQIEVPEPGAAGGNVFALSVAVA